MGLCHPLYVGTLGHDPFYIHVNDKIGFTLNPANPDDGDSADLIAGDPNNLIATPGNGSVVLGGCFGAPNSIMGNAETFDANYSCSILGGLDNLIDDDTESAVIVGGESNLIADNAYCSAIVCGFLNQTGSDADYSIIGAGRNNTLTGDNSVIAGGRHNQIIGDFSTISGGGYLTLGASSYGFQAMQFLDPTSGPQRDLSAFSSIAFFGDMDLWIGNADNSARKLKLFEPNSATDYSGANYSSFESQAQSANAEYILPASIGSVGNSLKIASVSGARVTLQWA